MLTHHPPDVALDHARAWPRARATQRIHACREADESTGPTIPFPSGGWVEDVSSTAAPTTNLTSTAALKTRVAELTAEDMEELGYDDVAARVDVEAEEAR